MPEKPKALQTMGVELEASGIKGAEIRFHKGRPCLERLFDYSLEIFEERESEHVKLLYKDPENKLDSLRIAQKKDLLVSTLPPNETIVRQIEIKLKKETDIDSVLRFQSEPLLPYPINQALLDKIRIEETTEGTLLALLAVRKDHLAKHLEQMLSLELEPETVSAVPVALTSFASHFAPCGEPRFLLHLGLSITTCVLSVGKKLIAAQTCPVGTTLIGQAYAADGSIAIPLEKIDLSSLDPKTYPTLSKAVSTFSMEVLRTFYSLAKQAKGKEIAEVFVTGDDASSSNLAEVLCKTYEKPSRLPEEDPGFQISVPELQKYAIPIGLALTALPRCKEQVNFRQEEYAYPNPWRRLKRPLALYFVSCLAMATSLYLFGISWIDSREDNLRKEYIELLGSMNKTYEEFENQYAEKHSSEKNPIPAKDLTNEEIANRLYTLETELRKSPDAYPLHPNVPRVSDLFAWLANHPKVQKTDPATGEKKPLLQIESFQYTMVKRPDQSRKKEKYQVKIELELSSPVPKNAREFHDALIAPNDMVDPKSEVKWTTTRNGYRTTFFLKDKAPYQ